MAKVRDIQQRERLNRLNLFNRSHEFIDSSVSNSLFIKNNLTIEQLHDKFVRFVETQNKKIMKSLSVLAAFLGGAAVGAALGILFAPEKGEDTRARIVEILRKKGIKLNRNEMDELVDQIASEIKGEE